LNVEAKFGGVDLSVDSAELRALDASTSWGQIYSDLTNQIQLSGDDMMGKEMKASLSSNGNKKVHLDTSFGNVYIRKK